MTDGIDSEEIERRVEHVADAIDANHEVRRRNESYRSRRIDRRVGESVALHLEDVSGIPFVSEVPGVEEYQHRARVRAGTGDLFAAVTPQADGYERYNRERLGLGEPQLVIADPDTDPLAVSKACARGEALDRIVDLVEDELVIHPYMAIEPVWELAARLRQRGIEAGVLGPPPPVLWIANDKARIGEINERLFDSPWNVATEVATDPKSMVLELVDLAESYERVGLKRTRCASAMGNIVFDSEKIREAGPQVLLRRVQRFLNRTEWPAGEEVLVVEWFDADVSPSTQTWIPPKDVGAPRLDGVYEQILKSEERIFVGSQPSTLPERVDRQLGAASLAVARVLQNLGYVGRCSFDFVVGGDLEGEFDARMIECNGRWGGTSTPMHLVDRLVDGERPAYVAMDFVHPDLVGASFAEIRGLLEEHLYDVRTGEGRFVLYNVGPLSKSGKFDVVSIGRSPEEAREGTEVVLPRELGLD